MRLPSDPNMLLSFVNMKLRDEGLDLSSFCARYDAAEEELMEKLSAAGYRYDRALRQFR